MFSEPKHNGGTLFLWSPIKTNYKDYILKTGHLHPAFIKCCLLMPHYFLALASKELSEKQNSNKSTGWLSTLIKDLAERLKPLAKWVWDSL